MSYKTQTTAGTIKSRNLASVETKIEEIAQDNEAKRKVAKQMLNEGFSLPIISNATGLRVGEIVYL
jgi:SOS response regulatory protein OraA/RecX